MKEAFAGAAPVIGFLTIIAFLPCSFFKLCVRRGGDVLTGHAVNDCDRVKSRPTQRSEPGVAKMIRISMALVLALVSIQLRAAWAESDRVAAVGASHSCFQSPDHCMKDFAKTHDRDYYDLCMLSERICRAYRLNWKLMSSIVKKDSAILSDCFPVVSVQDLLKLCRGDQSWEKDSCRENVVALTSEAVLSSKNWQSRMKRSLPVTCTKAESISDREYIRAFIDWAEKHPSQKNLNMYEGVLAATAAAWPCQTRRSRGDIRTRVKAH